MPHGKASRQDGTLPYLLPLTRKDQGFGGALEPRYIFGAGWHRAVSCYALFKGWLLLSQPAGCLSCPTSFPTWRTLAVFCRWSSLFPIAPRRLSPTGALLGLSSCMRGWLG